VYSPVMLLHILAGIGGLVSGAAAVTVRKGSPRHALVGHVFFISMLTLGVTAAYIGVTIGQNSNLVSGAFVVYLVGTAWLTARRPELQPGGAGRQKTWLRVVDWVGLAVALIGALYIGYGGYIAWQAPRHVLRGVPAGMSFFLASIALLCAVGDMRMIARGISGRARIARHLWRMCFGFFVATGSFFLARQRIFPMFIRKADIPEMLAVVPLVLLIFWLVRIRYRMPAVGKRAARAA
jgi:hypothetical protein